MADIMQFIAGLAPEQQQEAFALYQQQQQQQQVDPRMGMPGQTANPEAFRDYEGQGAIIGDQQAQAEQLRGSQMNPGMQTANAGFVAANPLSAVATGVNKFKGAYDAKQALQDKKDLSALKTKTQQSVAQEVFDRNKQQKQAQALRGNNNETSFA